VLSGQRDRVLPVGGLGDHLDLLARAWIRRRFFGTGFLRSLISITLGGVIIATISAALGAAVS
jgi:hypothetical protein